MKFKVYLYNKGNPETIEADQMHIGNSVLTFYTDNKAVSAFNEKTWQKVLKEDD